MTQPLLIEHDDGVDRVTLNRPESLNALDPSLIDALNAYFETLQRNRSTRVVVLKGAGQNVLRRARPQACDGAPRWAAGAARRHRSSWTRSAASQTS